MSTVAIWSSPNNEWLPRQYSKDAAEFKQIIESPLPSHKLAQSDSPDTTLTAVLTFETDDATISDSCNHDDDESNSQHCGPAEEKMMKAAEEGNMEELKEAISIGANVNFANEEQEAALHLAADVGSTKCVRVLLEAGANPNAADSDGISILQAAILGNHVDVIRLLLQIGADLDQPDADGDTPRMCVQQSDSVEVQTMVVRMDTKLEMIRRIHQNIIFEQDEEDVDDSKTITKEVPS
jgi:ankyrin repeat protein